MSHCLRFHYGEGGGGREWSALIYRKAKENRLAFTSHVSYCFSYLLVLLLLTILHFVFHQELLSLFLAAKSETSVTSVTTVKGSVPVDAPVQGVHWSAVSTVFHTVMASYKCPST